MLKLLNLNLRALKNYKYWIKKFLNILSALKINFFPLFKILKFIKKIRNLMHANLRTLKSFKSPIPKFFGNSEHIENKNFLLLLKILKFIKKIKEFHFKGFKIKSWIS